jgi:hypothetical protein
MIEIPSRTTRKQTPPDHGIGRITNRAKLRIEGACSMYSATWPSTAVRLGACTELVHNTM